MSGLDDPSVLLEPKIGKHGRNENGSGPPKTLSTHHLAERAKISRERQPRKGQSKQQASAASELPPHRRILSLRRSRGDRTALAHSGRASRCTSTPLAGHMSSGRRGSPTGSSTRCIPRPPPHCLLTRPSGGREGKEEGAAWCVTSEEVSARGEVFGTGGREEPEGRADLLRSA